MQVGLAVMDEDPAGALKIVRAADRAGVHSLWSIDYCNRSSLTRAAAFAAVSETSIVGTSVTPLFARAPLALAAAAADVQGIAGGRFVLGVGSSTRRMNQDWYGTALQHPAPQVRERIELIRRLTAHRSGPFRYEGQFDRVSMAHYDRTALPDSLTPPPCLRRVKRLEDAGVITGYRAVIDPVASGRGLEVFVDLEISASDLNTVQEFEATVAGYDEVTELRRMFGHPDYFLRVAVADQAAYEAFLTGRLIGLPGVLHVTSHLTMKKVKADD